MRPGPAAGPGGPPWPGHAAAAWTGENAAGYAEAARQACLDLLSTDLLPRLGPSGAAILTRTNGQAALVSRWLVAADIPVVTEQTASGWPTIP
jgi:hypothetical protein